MSTTLYVLVKLVVYIHLGNYMIDVNIFMFIV